MNEPGPGLEAIDKRAGGRLSRRRFLALAGVAAAGLAVAGYEILRPAPAAPHVLWGAYVQPREGQSNREAFSWFESLIGRKLAVARFYSRWDVRLPNDYQIWAARSGRIPIISWEAERLDLSQVRWAIIASGVQDRWIEAQAKRLAALARPVLFSFNHEPENDANRGTPSEFVAAWEHVRGMIIFDSAGASNLTWALTLMAPTYEGENGGPSVWIPPHYDLLGVDGYNRAPCYPKTEWRSFHDIFAASREFAAARGKGLVVMETGTLEQTDCGNAAGDPNAKAQWLLDLRETCKSWPEIRVLDYSDTVADFRGYRMDYTVDTSSASLAAYREVGLDPYFGASVL